MSLTEFGARLAMEWASFPVLATRKGSRRTVQRGQSYYAGDGLNKALVRPEAVEAVLSKVLAAGNVVRPPNPAPDAPPPRGLDDSGGPRRGLWSAVLAGIAQFLRLLVTGGRR